MRHIYLAVLLTVLLGACTKPDDKVPGTGGGSSTTTGALLPRDESFSAGVGFMSPAGYPDVLGIYPAPDGKMYVTTVERTMYNNQPVGPVCRLNQDGTLDASFSSFDAFDKGEGRVLDLKILSDGHIAVVGVFRLNDAQGSYNISVLNPDGSLDPQFVKTGSGPSGKGVYCVEEDEQGRLVVGGEFTTLDGTAYSANVVTYKRDGKPDLPVTWPVFNARVNDIYRGTSNTLWIGGEFSKVSNQSSVHVAQLSTTGSVIKLSTTLLNTRQTDGGVHAFIPTSDGKYYVVGAFTYVRENQTIKNIIRLNADLSVDPSFRYGNDFSGDANTMILCGAITAAGNLIIGGDFPYSGGNFGMIKSDGSVDKRLLAEKGGTGDAGSFVRGIIIDGQKRYYMAGSFSYYEAEEAGGIVRLKGGD